MSEFEPKIVALCCHYCAYAAADLAGSLRLEYPPNIRIIRLPCTGRVEIREILEAFLQGADGVLVVGCLEGNCHYLEGNLKAKRRVERARKLLEEAKIQPDRLEFHNRSASMGPQLAQLFTEFTDRIRKLGPGFAAEPAKEAVNDCR